MNSVRRGTGRKSSPVLPTLSKGSAHNQPRRRTKKMGRVPPRDLPIVRRDICSCY